MRLVFPLSALIFLSAIWLKLLYPAAAGFADTDFFWHIAYGRWMIEHGQIPAGDIFSWTMSGEPYRLTQWLGEVLMGVAYESGELHGTRILSLAVTGGTLWFAWRAAALYIAPLPAVVIALLCNLVQIVLPMRPQMFSFLMIALVAWLLASWKVKGGMKWLYPMPLLMALWVNLHGGYIVGLIMLAIVFVGELLESHAAGKLYERRSTLYWLTGIGLASLLATLLNPYGWYAWYNVIMISGLESSKVISEWMPVNVTTEVGWFYLMNLVPFIALMIVTPARPTISESLMAGFFLFFGLTANRQVAMMAAAMAPLLAALLSRTPQYAGWREQMQDHDRPWAHSLTLLALAMLAIPVMLLGAKSQAEKIRNQYPIDAVAFMKEQGLTKRVLSDTLEASYLIYQGIPVFVDGRMDLYRDRFYFEWYLAYKAAPGWEKVIEKWQPESMLLRNDMAIRQVLMAKGEWKLIYVDDRYSVMVPLTHTAESVEDRLAEILDQKGKMIRGYLP